MVLERCRKELHDTRRRLQELVGRTARVTNICLVREIQADKVRRRTRLHEHLPTWKLELSIRSIESHEIQNTSHMENRLMCSGKLIARLDLRYKEPVTRMHGLSERDRLLTRPDIRKRREDSALLHLNVIEEGRPRYRYDASKLRHRPIEQ